jgi:hypothetical protein
MAQLRPKELLAPVKLVYTHPNSIVVAQARNALQLAEIECTLRNEYAAGALGELAPIDTWPELWVVRDRDFDRATIALNRSREELQEDDWPCHSCGNESPASFEFCWHCAKERKVT